MRGRLLIATMLFFSAFPGTVFADTVLRTGTDISVAQDQVIDGNYYVSVFFGETAMSGAVGGDMLALGGTVTMNGEVKKDLLVTGGSVQVHGPVGEDIRILGGEVTIADKVAGDLFVFGGALRVLPSAEIGGDVFFFGGTAEIEGTVTGSVYGNAEQFNINAPVGKNIDVSSVLGVTLGARALVGGDVRYTSASELVRDTNAMVTGTVVKNTQEEVTAKEKLKSTLIPFLILLFTTLSLYLIFKREVESLVVQVTNSYLVSGFVGLGVIVFGPLISVLLMVTVLGFMVGLLGMFVVLAVIVAGVAFASLVMGGILSLLFVKRVEVSLIWIVLGSAVLYTCLFIPVFGAVLYLSVCVITIGGLVTLLYKSIA